MEFGQSQNRFEQVLVNGPIMCLLIVAVALNTQQNCKKQQTTRRHVILAKIGP